jgi:hypothetical protein
MLKENQVAVAGRVNGVWNNQTKGFEIKTGVTQNGKKWQIFEISVSKRDGDTWVNGKGMKVMLWGDTAVVEKTMVGVMGRFQPDNYTNKEGVEIRGLMINAFDNDMFTPEQWEQGGNQPVDTSGGAPDPVAPDNVGDDLPF